LGPRGRTGLRLFLEDSSMSRLPCLMAFKLGFRCRRYSFLAVAVALLASSPPAHAGLTITPIFDSSITNDPNAAAIEGVINTAISVYESLFTNPITVTINFSEMNSGLGANATFFANGPYGGPNGFLTALNAAAVNPDQFTALAVLNAAGSSTNPVNGNARINVKTADLRAVGINVNPPPGFPDGFIGLNTHITDVGSPGTIGLFSLLATTEHEINEVLGLGSALPSIPFGTIFPQDLYRYDASGNRSFTTNS